MNEAWMDDIDKITEKQEFVKTLRDNKFTTTADEYIEMCGALKLFIAQKLEEARKEVAEEFMDLFVWVDRGHGHGHVAFSGEYGTQTKRILNLKDKYLKED